MAEKKITQLNAAAVPLSGTELVEMVQGGFSVRGSTSAIANTFSGTLTANKGGTGFSSYAIGDILYADTLTTLAKLPDVAVGNVLLSGGVSLAPSWGKVDLAAAVTGVTPVVNGGTGAATLTGYVKGNGTSAMTASATIPAADLAGSVSVPNGGTGAATLTGYVKGNGTSAMTASATIPYADMAGRAYLSAYHPTDQTGVVGVANLVVIGTTVLSQGITIVTNGSALTRITYAVAGVYMIAPSIQFYNSSASDYNASIWLRKNGTDIGNTATVLTVPKLADGGQTFFQIVFYEQLAANDYIEIVWEPKNVAVILDGIVAAGVVPAAPSVILCSERIA